MAVVEELLRSEADGTISFGNHLLESKAKAENFEHCGDLYKVKTFKAMTKLERNGMFAYSSVPGTSVLNFSETADSVSFSIGTMKTNLGGKLNISVELEENKEVGIKVTR